MWAGIIKIFNEHGATGAITIVGIIIVIKMFEQNNNNFQTLFKNVIETNKSNVESIKTSIEKLSEIVNKNIQYQDDYLKKIAVELNKLKQEIFETDTKIIQMILDDKRINNITFYKLSQFIVSAQLYSSIIDLINYIDNVVFINDSDVDNFKEEAEMILEGKRQKIQQELYELNYNEDIINKIEAKITSLYATHWANFQNKIIKPVYDMSYRDSNYRELKRKIVNNIITLSDEIVDYINDIVKK